MPIKTVPPAAQAKAWSYSAYKLYEQCPLKFKLAKLDRIQEPVQLDGPLHKGNVTHAFGESYVGKVVPKLAPEIQPYQAKMAVAAKGKVPAAFAAFSKELQALRKIGPLVEQQWAFDVNWQPTSWFAGNAWLRLKLDAHYLRAPVLPIVDYKTGRIYPEEGQLQMNLYGLVGLLVYAAAKTALPALWYLDQPRNASNPMQHEYHRKDVPALMKDWNKRVKAMFADRRFAPRPGQYCRWCFFRKSNKANGGGQCKY